MLYLAIVWINLVNIYGSELSINNVHFVGIVPSSEHIDGYM